MKLPFPTLANRPRRPSRQAADWARWRWIAVCLQWLLVAAAGHGQTRLDLQADADGRFVRLMAGGLAGKMLQLDHSRDLVLWTEKARVLDELHSYREGVDASSAHGFYRVQARPTRGDDDWSNQLLGSSSALFQPGSGGGAASIAFAKWTIALAQPDRVYFQDSVKYPYHLTFARARLPGYATMGALEFNALSLYASPAQKLVLGSVLRAPDPQIRELGIQITGQEAFPAAQCVEWVDAVRQRLVVEPGWRVFYLPSVEQQAETEAHRPLFAARGLEVDSLKRWITDNACFSAGWALGRLVYVASADIPRALGEGRLRFDDILVTDHVPAELPVLAGYVCLQPATPNSHVALLARSLLLPFAHANGTSLQAELASLYGREILLAVSEEGGSCRITLTDATGRLTPEQRAEILRLKQGGPLDITPKAPRGRLVVSVDEATPADIRFIGGKAAHFGFLRRTLPDESPHPALAITFDLWDSFLSQSVAPGMSLGQFIQSKLAGHTYPPNVPALRTDLDAIRSAIQNTADFTPEQRAIITASLQNAGLTGANIRFRSSTNVEDAENFSGAGLYDSFSGCLEDDLDGDTAGPSWCDPTEAKERGVFRAIRKVYASFYNENAFLERLRHSVDETTVGMAVLVHFSVPDIMEMANGVATLTVDITPGGRTSSTQIVSQLGAVSVTNPDGRVQPEVVAATWADNAVEAAPLTRPRASSLTPDGSPVMTWTADYRTLLRQMLAAANAYESYYPQKNSYELDFEFKRLTPGLVGVKQMRPVPHPTPVPVPTLP